LGLIANLQNDGNLSGDDDRDGVVAFKADFENFQRDN
jgi:hypothetical protein